jgi:hypothetical protein
MSWRRPRAFALRLHVSAAPPRGGLTQALGGRKRFLITCSVARLCRLRPCCLRIFHGYVPSSVTAWCALKCCKRCACWLRKRRSSTESFPTPDTLLRRRPAEGLLGALGSSRFGFRQTRWAFKFASIHRHLTIRSSRPHVVASAMCFTLRSHMSAAPPRVGLTQALGPTEQVCRQLSRLLR